MPSIIKVDQIQSDQGFVNVSSNLQFSSGFTMLSPTLTTPTLSSPTLTTPTITGQATIPTINLTGGQIVFPATQNASSDANTLDDYEEGTWTPTDLSGAGLTFSNQGSAYVKVGQMVLVQSYINWPVTGNTTATQIGGLPFAVLNYNSYYYGPCRVQVPNVMAAVQLNSDTNYFYIYTPSGNGIYTNAQLSGGYVLFSCCYQAKV